MLKRSWMKCDRGLGTLDALEARVLLTFNPTASEQYMLELMNSMRIDPASALGLLTNSLANPARSRNTDIDGALRQFAVKGTTLRAQWDRLRAAPPLAWSEALYGSSQYHSQRMIAEDMQEHELPGPDRVFNTADDEPRLGQRMMTAGYTGLTTYGENIYAYARSVIHGHAGFAIDWGDQSGPDPAVDGIQNPPGHRDNIMDAEFREVGIRILTENNSGTDVGPLVITQDFASHIGFGNPWLLGVAFRDGNNDHLYSPGEGLGSVSVRVVGSGGTFTTTSMDAGGYQLKVPSGIYDVTFSGGGYGSSATYRNILIGGANLKLDGVSGQTPPAPNIVVMGNSVAIASGDVTPSAPDWTDFGAVNLAQTLERTFIIKNAGTAPLQLSGSPRVKITGPGIHSFALVDDGAGFLMPGETTTFTLRYEPIATNNVAVTITLRSDDADTPVYTFKVQGHGVDEPEIDLTGSTGRTIADGDRTPTIAEGTKFAGLNTAGEVRVRLFTITNHGSSTLTLNRVGGGSGAGGSFVRITGAQASDFAVVTQPDASIAPGRSTTFRVSFNPSRVGERTATVLISSNDTDEATYDFAVTGTGVLAPIVQVLGLGAAVIPAGNTPDAANGTLFGPVSAAGGFLGQVFTITNIGSSNLVLNAVKRVRVHLGTGALASYRINMQPDAAVLAPGQSTVFRVRFDPARIGDLGVQVIVGTVNAGSFEFNLLGTGV